MGVLSRTRLVFCHGVYMPGCKDSEKKIMVVSRARRGLRRNLRLPSSSTACGRVTTKECIEFPNLDTLLPCNPCHGSGHAHSRKTRVHVRTRMYLYIHIYVHNVSRAHPSERNPRMFASRNTHCFHLK